MKQKDRHLPSLFIGLEQFELNFPSLSPSDFIDYLQKQPAKQLIFVEANSVLDKDEHIHYTTFAMKYNIRTIGIWVVGDVYTTDNSDALIVGKISIDFEILFYFLAALVISIVASIRFSEPIVLFVLIWIPASLIFLILLVRINITKSNIINVLKNYS